MGSVVARLRTRYAAYISTSCASSRVSARAMPSRVINSFAAPMHCCKYDAVYQKGGMTQKEICRRTFQSKQTVNLIIKNLLAENYVTVTEVPENKRSKLVQMTGAGMAYCEKVVRHITWAEDTAMSMFTPEEQKQLIGLSRKFTKNLTRLVNLETEDA